MAKKKAVEPPVEQPEENKAELIKQLLAKRELASAQDQIFIDKQLAEITMGELK